MSKTAAHNTHGQDASLKAIDALATLELGGLSFVQLSRLQKILGQACADVRKEVERRSEADNAGDTVRVPSPNL